MPKPRWVAFLRGVSPGNCKMDALAAAFEAAGFEDVKTVLGSGNVVFGAKASSPAALAKRAEAAMLEGMGRSFSTIIRAVDVLRAMLEEDPFADLRVPRGAKRVVTFLREPPRVVPDLPLAKGQARIVRVSGAEAFTYYVPTPGQPVFMTLIEKTFGKDVTTRTWETVEKVSR